MTEQIAVVRNLNDHECMLASSTCNVGVIFQLNKCGDHGPEQCKDWIRQAWSTTMERYECLQVCLQAKTEEIGPLGQRYTIVRKKDEQSFLDDSMISFGSIEDNSKDLLEVIQHVGTTKLDWLESSFYVRFDHDPQSSSEASYTSTWRMVLSLCHSLSDGPGSLTVVDTFLSNLAQQQSASPQQPQDCCLPCADLQADLLGSDYGATISPNSDVYPRLEEIRSAMLAKDNDDEDSRHILTPEAMQNLPRSKDDDGAIHATCFQLSQEETRGLIATCKAHNCTIQAALNVAFALARLSKLQTPIPCLVPIQIPMNCRGLAVNHDNDQSEDSCLCGSAGWLWQLLEVHPEKMLLSDLAKTSTQQMRHDMHA
jgi:hypothetical protein